MMDFNLPALMTKKMMLSWIELRNFSTRTYIASQYMWRSRSSPPMRAATQSLPAQANWVCMHAATR